jgi:hypothetical protein
MPRKRDPAKPPRVNVGVRFNPNAVALFDELAARWGLDRSEVVRRLAARGYAGLKNGERP